MPDYYPPVGFHFKVQFDGIEQSENDTFFQTVSGLSATIETEEVAVGGENRYKLILPVRTKFPNLVLKRGMLIDSPVIKWCKDAIEDFEFNPIDLTVTLLNEEHMPLTTWKIVHAYPIRWEVEEFNSMDSKLVAETIELTYNYFTTTTT